ncbi:MAG: iron ABC transporter permease, partial [Gemmatimonadetes bacterium]|nr:iron ABC transporter permease [Gemmatimonadota bacterium]
MKRAERLAQGSLLAVLLYLVGAPVVFLAISSFKPTGLPPDPGWTFANYVTVFGDAEFAGILANTVAFVAGSVLLAVGVALALVLLIERTDVMGRRMLRWLILLPMAAPPLLVGVAWALLLSPRSGTVNRVLQRWSGASTGPFDIYSLGGMVFVEGLVLVPTAYLMLMPAVRAMDSTLEEAALASGASAVRVLRSITLSLLRPAILATAIFLAIAGFVMFDIPGVLGLPGRVFVLSTQVFVLVSEQPSGLPRYGEVAAMGSGLLVLLVGLAFAYRAFSRQADRFAVVSGRAGTRRLLSLGGLRPWASLMPWAYVMVAAVLPTAVLIWTSLLPYVEAPGSGPEGGLTLANHTALFSDGRMVEAVTHTLVVALVSASAVAVLAGLTAWFARRGGGALAPVLDILSFAPVAIPGVLLGVALVFVYLSLTVVPIYGHLSILIVAYITMYLAYGTRAMHGVVAQFHGDLMDAASSCGAGLSLTLRRVVLPLSLTGLVAVWS